MHGVYSRNAEMYVQGESTRKGKAVTEALCGHGFSASSISEINKQLDQQLAEPFPYLILNARYERVREGGVIVRQGGADLRRHRLGRPTPDAGGGAGQPGEPVELAGVPAHSAPARPERREVRGLGQPRGAEVRREAIRAFV